MSERKRMPIKDVADFIEQLLGFNPNQYVGWVVSEQVKGVEEYLLLIEEMTERFIEYIKKTANDYGKKVNLYNLDAEMSIKLKKFLTDVIEFLDE